MRLPRRNPDLNDAIELLDQHYVASDKNAAQAWARLSSDELVWIETEIEKALDLRYYLENYHTIRTENGVVKTLYPFWDHQEILFEAMQEEWEENGYCKVIVLKPRQTGISVWTAASMFHRTIFMPHTFTMIIAQNIDTSAHLYKMSLNAYDLLPWWLRPEYLYKTKHGAIEFQRTDEKLRGIDPGLGSVIQVSPANQTSGVAIGRSIRNLHMCLSNNNTVINEYGMAISIADAACGTRVFTGYGYPGFISAHTKREARSLYPGAENGYKITPWCSSAFPLEGTGNHKILACPIYRLNYKKNGKQVTERTIGDLQMMPFHKLTERWTGVALPVPEITAHGHVPEGDDRPRLRKRAAKYNWSPPKPSREFGFAVGLYLAEGNGSGGRLDITLDSDEQYLADRFSKAVGVKYRIGPHAASRTVHYLFECCALRDWFKTNVGHLDGKRIQQWMWNVGRDFLSGVLEGMILGDGHVSPRFHVISVSTTREQLAIALRWVAAALGHGWANINSRKAGFHYGRNCKKIWILDFCQKADGSIREEYNLEPCPNKKQRNASHWMYTHDKTHIICPIRKIERVHLEYVYDIEVQNQRGDHTYLLPAALTHNSEVSRYPSDDMYEGDVRPSMNARDTYAVMESTGFGRQGLFYEQWCAAVDGDTDFRAVFIPVYKVKKYYLPIHGAFDLAEDEKTFNERIKKEEHFEIPDEFWNFRRRGLRGAKRAGNKAGFLESYPISPAEAFQSSGLCAFDRDSLEWQQLYSVCKPLYAGEIFFVDMVKKPNTTDIMVVKDEEELPRRKSGRGGRRFHIWEMPERNSTYYVSADVALGNGGDFSVCEVFRAGIGVEPDTQVAEWWGWIPPRSFAHVVAAIGQFYNEAEVAVEYEADGITTGNELRELDYPNLYRPQWHDKITQQNTNWLHFVTNHKTRTEIIGTMNEALLERRVVQGKMLVSVMLRSADLLDEMIDFAAIDGNRMEGQGNHDDGVMASMIGLYCLRETTKHLKTAAVAEDKQQDSGLSYIYGLYDNLMRQRGQFNTQAEADRMKGANAGWTVRPIPVTNANTLFSPIFDAMGAEFDLHAKHGLHSTEITPEVVWAYKSALSNFRGSGQQEMGDDW